MSELSMAAELARQKGTQYAGDPDGDQSIWDIALVTDDGKRVHANRSDLVALSPVFRVMFARDREAGTCFKAAKQGEVRIRGVAGDVLRDVIAQALSQAALPLGGATAAAAYLDAGDRLQLDSVRDEVCAYLAAALSPATAIPTLVLAECHSCDALRGAAIALAAADLQRAVAQCPPKALCHPTDAMLLEVIAQAPESQRRGAALLDIAAAVRRSEEARSSSSSSSSSLGGSSSGGSDSGDADDGGAAAATTTTTEAAASLPPPPPLRAAAAPPTTPPTTTQQQQQRRPSPRRLPVDGLLPLMVLEGCTTRELLEVGRHELLRECPALQLALMDALAEATAGPQFSAITFLDSTTTATSSGNNGGDGGGGDGGGGNEDDDDECAVVVQWTTPGWRGPPSVSPRFEVPQFPDREFCVRLRPGDDGPTLDNGGGGGCSNRSRGQYLSVDFLPSASAAAIVAAQALAKYATFGAPSTRTSTSVSARDMDVLVTVSLLDNAGYERARCSSSSVARAPGAPPLALVGCSWHLLSESSFEALNRSPPGIVDDEGRVKFCIRARAIPIPRRRV